MVVALIISYSMKLLPAVMKVGSSTVVVKQIIKDASFHGIEYFENRMGIVGDTFLLEK